MHGDGFDKDPRSNNDVWVKNPKEEDGNQLPSRWRRWWFRHEGTLMIRSRLHEETSTRFIGLKQWHRQGEMADDEGRIGLANEGRSIVNQPLDFNQMAEIKPNWNLD